MKARIFPATVLLCLPLGLNQCATAHPPNQPTVESLTVSSEPSVDWEPEEYVVYSAFIDQTFLLEENHIIPIFDFTIRQIGSTDDARKYIKKKPERRPE
jgi:hypothetical protein